LILVRLTLPVILIPYRERSSVEMAMKFKSQDEIMASMAEMRQGMRRDEVERFVGGEFHDQADQ
jgi:hypothetical protein